MVNYWCNIVDEKHNLLLEDLSHISEISDIAEPEYPNHLCSCNQRVNGIA
jgi:hypothetical protein